MSYFKFGSPVSPQSTSSSGLVFTPTSPTSPGTINVDEYGMWIIGDQLFVGYGTYNTVEDIITLCRQTAQYIHVCPTLSDPEALLKFVQVLNSRLANIRAGSLGVTRELGNKRLKELLHRYLQRIAEISPLLISSIEAYLQAGTDAGKAHASQNRDCFKQQLLETIRDFVLLLQLIKNKKPVPSPSPLQEDLLRKAQDWLGGSTTILTNTGFDAIRQCLHDGRNLASQLNVGIDKGELMGLCSEAELSATQLRELYKKGMGSGPDASVLAIDLSRQLSHIRDRMVEALSRKTLDDFMGKNEPVQDLERAALIAHYKPNRDITFTEKRFRFEELCKHISGDVDLVCRFGMVASAAKVEELRHEADVLAGLGPQVVWAAKLLFTNPYSEILIDHFNHLKQAWLRKADQLKGLLLSYADLRTWQKQLDNRCYISRSSVSPSKYVSSVRLQPKEPTPPPPATPPKPKVIKEQPTWESADKDLVLACRKLAMIMCRLVYLVRNDGATREELLNSSKDIVRACNIVSRLTKELALGCSDRRNQALLMKYVESIPTLATQLKMVCTVKAATVGSQAAGCDEDEQATEMLLENSRNLMSSVRETVHTAAAASINIRVAAGQFNW